MSTPLFDDTAVGAWSAKHPTYGTSNPTIMDNPFWKYMICYQDKNAWWARKNFDIAWNDYTNGSTVIPVWCFDRFGRTSTIISDGRLVLIGGEHEDSYDPDFCIYNDVVVIEAPHKLKNSRSMFADPSIVEMGTYNPNTITIYGYPPSIFPPTDFHTATLVKHTTLQQEYIYIIGGLGYIDSVTRTQTDVFRLNISDFSITKMDTTGEGPAGGINNHTAELELDKRTIKITPQDNGNNNNVFYRLNLEGMVWTTQRG